MKAVAPRIKKRSCTSVVAVNDHLYAIGAMVGNSNLNNVERYDPVTDVWTEIPSMLEHRINFAATVLNGKIYVCGKYNRIDLQSMEVFDPVSIPGPF